MKKTLVLMLFSAILCTSSACAENTNETDNESTSRVKFIERNEFTRIELVCIDNYQFVIYAGQKGGGIVQMIEKIGAYVQPKRCNK